MCLLWLLYHSWNLFKRSWRVDEPVQFAAAEGYTSLGIADYGASNDKWNCVLLYLL